MVKKTTAAASGMLSEIIIKGLQEKKGVDIVSLDLRKLPHSISDYFILCHGTSRTHVHALAESVEKEVRQAVGVSPIHTEGLENSEWILLDYFDVVVHIFQENRRSFYNLEGLWADAVRSDIS